MISVFGSLIDQAEIDNVVACMKSQWMGFGRQVADFEEAFSNKFDITSFAMVDSGSNALFMAVKLLNLPPGSEIILPSFTWVSCAQAIILAGHKPVFCDVDIQTMNVTADHIKPHITPATSAIMIVHYAGLPVDMAPIIDLGFPVIEDAAHAVCSKHHGTQCGAISDVGIYSFDAVKNLTVGEGGGITSIYPELIERARKLRYCGIGKSGFDSAVSKAPSQSNSLNRWWEYDISEPFIKMLPTNLAGSIGLAQLDKIDSLQSYRQQIWTEYQNSFSNIPDIKTPLEAPDHDTHSYFTYCIRCPRRDELAHFLLSKGIYTTLRYHPLHLNPLYNQTLKELPNSQQLNNDALSIPLHPRMSSSDISHVIDSIVAFY